MVMDESNIRKKKNKGFTLVELVIVVAILAILVGMLAPQYTKYVENSRKAADASNMDEMVKAIETYAYDGANQLSAPEYILQIGYGKGTKNGSFIQSLDGQGKPGKSDSGISNELDEQFPDWSKKLETKSKKWGTNGSAESIQAHIVVQPDGGISVSYSPKKFAEYLGKPEYVKNKS